MAGFHMNTRPTVTQLLRRQSPQSIAELEDAIRASECVDISRSFERLAEAIRQTDCFLEKTLPFLWQPDEAIVVIGTEQFSTARGYASSLDYGGSYVDSTPLPEDGVRPS